LLIELISAETTDSRRLTSLFRLFLTVELEEAAREAMLEVSMNLQRLMEFLRILVRIIWLKILQLSAVHQFSYAKIAQVHPHHQAKPARRIVGQLQNTLTGRSRNTVM